MIIPASIIAAAELRRPAEAAVKALGGKVRDRALLPPDSALQEQATPSELVKRAVNLSFAGAKPSTTELERLIGSNDLVDEFYLQRALIAAQPVMRITLRDGAGRERGWATGFMVSPRLLLTNWHVFPSSEESTNAVIDANYVLDLAGNPAVSYRFAVRGDVFYISNPELDFCLVAVDSLAQDGRTLLAQFGFHRLIAEPNKIREGESMTLIQHPGGERRQFAVRENQLKRILDDFLWYASDTAPGSSGAPAFNDSFQVVALHHSGAARRDGAGNFVLKDGSTVPSLDGIDDSRIVWEANEGVRVSVLCSFLRSNLRADDPYVRELFESMNGGDVMSNAIKGIAAPPSPVDIGVRPSEIAAGGAVLTIPLQIQISLTSAAPANAGPAQQIPIHLPNGAATSSPGAEALRYPVVDRDYSDRKTPYDPDFLKVPAPLPVVKDQTLVSKMADGDYRIPYEHFTVVLNKKRRLALFTAANIDYSEKRRRPEPGDYSRDGLSGLGPNDQEKWLTDPRIPQQDQLPDVFYTADGGQFDKGHIVRREDVCWGETRERIVRANGDTFHVTNCTPQIAGFNRSADGTDNWGDLENEIQKQAKAETLSVLAGPILAADDKSFEGRDAFGRITIQIPREFWKVVLANEGGKLAAYAFVLQQDLRNLPAEFRVTAVWKPYLVSLAHLQSRVAGFVFSKELLAADKSAHKGKVIAAAVGAEVHGSVAEAAPASASH